MPHTKTAAPLPVPPAVTSRGDLFGGLVARAPTARCDRRKPSCQIMIRQLKPEGVGVTTGQLVVMLKAVFGRIRTGGLIRTGPRSRGRAIASVGVTAATVVATAVIGDVRLRRERIEARVLGSFRDQENQAAALQDQRISFCAVMTETPALRPPRGDHVRRRYRCPARRSLRARCCRNTFGFRAGLAAPCWCRRGSSACSRHRVRR